MRILCRHAPPGHLFHMNFMWYFAYDQMTAINQHLITKLVILAGDSDTAFDGHRAARILAMPKHIMTRLPLPSQSYASAMYVHKHLRAGLQLHIRIHAHIMIEA